MLAVTFGGVTNAQIIAAMAGLLAFMANNVCLFFSLCRPTLKDATGVARSAFILWLVLPNLLFLPILILMALGTTSPIFTTIGNTLSSALNWYLNMQLPRRLWIITSSTFNESWLSWQVIFDLCVGCLFFYVSWRRFEPLTIDTEPVVAVRPKKKSFAFSPPKPKLTSGQKATPEVATVRAAEQCWNNPFLWKEFQFRCGGWPGLRWQWLKFLMGYSAVVGLISLSFLLTLLLEASRAGTTAGFNTSGFFIRLWESVTFLGGLIIWVSCLVMLRLLLSAFYDSFTEELQQKTYSTMLLTPNDARRIAFSTVLGRLFTLLPGLVWVFTGFLMFIISIRIPRGYSSSSSSINWNELSQMLLILGCIFTAFCTFLPWLFYMGLWSQNALSNTGKWMATLLLLQLEFWGLVLIATFFDWNWRPWGFLTGVIYFLIQGGLAYFLYVRIPRLMQLRMGD
ncbi:MAG: hypothetical protein U0903_16180 [Planctomycetales bacterium]